MVKIKNYEMVDPLDLVKGIDETMDIIKKDDFDFNLENSKELIYNLLFLSRCSLLFNVAITKILNLKNVEENIKKEIEKLYI